MTFKKAAMVVANYGGAVVTTAAVVAASPQITLHELFAIFFGALMQTFAGPHPTQQPDPAPAKV